MYRLPFYTARDGGTGESGRTVTTGEDWALTFMSDLSVDMRGADVGCDAYAMRAPHRSGDRAELRARQVLRLVRGRRRREGGYLRGAVSSAPWEQEVRAYLVLARV